jgi:hypothetical protein
MRKIRYLGRDKDDQIQVLSIPIAEAVEKGMSFQLDGCDMTITENEELAFLIHRHAPHLNIKLNNSHEYTINQLFAMCPYILEDLIDLYGGKEYLAEILIHYDELYKQEETIKLWKEKENQL